MAIFFKSFEVILTSIPLILALSLRGIAAYNVTFLVCMSYTSLGYSYDYYGPAIDMAMQSLTRSYGDVIDFRKVDLSPREIHSCPDLDQRSLALVTGYLFNTDVGIRQWEDPDNLMVVIGNGQ